MRIRVIPSLLLHKGGLIKSVQFKNYKYVGDPINAVKIFNEKEVDEIAVIDIDATRDNRPPDFDQIKEIASEAFMPMAYGGGITTIDQIKKILFNGIEKVIINKALHTNINLVTQAANLVGSQSVVASIDIKKALFGGYKIYTDNGRNSISTKPEQFAKDLENAGAGEILVNNIDADGTYKGFDTNLIHQITSAVKIPVIAIGGAGNVEDFCKAKQAGASAVAAGSMFVFQRPHQAVLISYPTQKELKEKLFK
ncbi:AglZ/HisF2 family acetamidino modification protein [Ferruginibacter sp. SUN002]|uniref:AglZ/HisF2 family acetamidino modification protein n=1 Tax=Ferruginibacter sp. SUN002 TaxID=2937789 RepID=UPI003D36E7B8